jgi:hypothetical protein
MRGGRFPRLFADLVVLASLLDIEGDPHEL